MLIKLKSDELVTDCQEEERKANRGTFLTDKDKDRALGRLVNQI